MQTVRLFVGMRVPAAFKAMVSDLPMKGMEARWNHVDDLHITIRFLGDTDQRLLPDIRAALDRVKRPPFHVDVSGFDAFYNDSQTIFYADIQSTKKLTALVAEVNCALEPLGFEMPMRPYVPHITLARLNKAARGLDAYMDRHEGNMRVSWRAEDFALVVSSGPDEKGRMYKDLARYRLL